MEEHEPGWLDLYDYRKRVFDLYREREASLLAEEDELAVLGRFRARKDELYAQHPQSPLTPEQRRHFTGLSYFPHDPGLRLEASLEPEDDGKEQELPAGGAHASTFRLAARLHFSIEGRTLQLSVYWIDVYGGGLFLPFRDRTSGHESYGGGRYLFDTVKGSDFVRLDARSDMGYMGGRVIIDFNYAYNPSCAYDSRWVCPLAPAENRLPVAIRAGERDFDTHYRGDKQP